MRKKFYLLFLLFTLFLLIPINLYSQNTFNDVSGLISKMPDDIKIIAYTKPSRFANNEYLKQFIEGDVEKLLLDQFTKSSDLLIGLGEFNGEYEPETGVIYIKGEHIFDNIYNLLLEKGENLDVTNIMNTPTIYGDDEIVMMSISPDLTAITTEGNERKVIEAAKHNANTLNKNSDIYRLAKDMSNYTLGWIVADINYFGEIDLNEFEIPSLKGTITPQTLVVGSYEDYQNFYTFISLDIDDPETASSIAPIINFLIPMAYAQFGQILPIDNPEINNEITHFVKSIQVSANQDKIETNITIKKDLLKALGEMAITGASEAFSSPETLYEDDGYAPEDDKYEEPYYNEDGYDAKEEYGETFDEDEDYITTEPGIEIEDEETYASGDKEKTEENKVLTYDKETISSKVIIQKINKGENVYYKNVVVEGELNFIKINDIAKSSENVYTSYVSPSVTFDGCVFKDEVTAYLEENNGKEVYYTMFQKNVSFVDCVFNKEIDLSSVRFENRTDFNSSLFRKEAKFNKTDFDGDVNFKDATFEDVSNFYGCQFGSRGLFESANFKKLANFKEANFSEYANFKNTTFEDKANFNEINFKELANFSESHFYEKSYFNNVLFLTKAFFKNAMFEDKAFFEWASFNGQANFTNTTFKNEANFGKAIFKDDAYFGKIDFKFNEDEKRSIDEGNTKFLNGAYFGSTLFSGSAYFSEVEMKGEAYFYGARFVGYADFRRVDFESEANFGLTQFNTDVYFAKCIFQGKANFLEALFTSKAYFENTSFKDDAIFSKAQFIGYAYFPQVVFEGKAQFKNTQYLGHAFFKYAVFVGDADFYKAYFIGNVDFTGVVFKTEASFKGSKHNEKSFDPTND